MTKRLLTLALLLTTSLAQAGFVTGFVAGRITSGGGSSEGALPEASATVFSDKHDVIACPQSQQPGRCRNEAMAKQVVDKRTLRGWREEHPTEAEYAAACGYKLIHRRGVVIQNGIAWVIMEVSK
jgi:hypothetical protein